MKKTLFATHSKEVCLAEGGSGKVQMASEDIKPGKLHANMHANMTIFDISVL